MRSPSYHFDENGFKVYRYVNDLAVVKVETPLPCSERVLYPACLPSRVSIIWSVVPITVGVDRNPTIPYYTVYRYGRIQFL